MKTMLHLFIVLCLSCDGFALEADSPTKDLVYVLAYLSHTNDPKDEDHIIFKAVAFNGYGQIVFWRNYDNKDKTISKIVLGEKNVSSITATIQSFPDGKISFNFDSSSVGSSLKFIGVQGNTLNVHDIPMAIFPDRLNESYFAFGKVSSLDELPQNTLRLDLDWSSPEALKKKLNVSK